MLSPYYKGRNGIWQGTNRTLCHALSGRTKAVSQFRSKADAGALSHLLQRREDDSGGGAPAAGGDDGAAGDGLDGAGGGSVDDRGGIILGLSPAEEVRLGEGEGAGPAGLAHLILDHVEVRQDHVRIGFHGGEGVLDRDHAADVVLIVDAGDHHVSRRLNHAVFSFHRL